MFRRRRERLLCIRGKRPSDRKDTNQPYEQPPLHEPSFARRGDVTRLPVLCGRRVGLLHRDGPALAMTAMGQPLTKIAAGADPRTARSLPSEADQIAGLTRTQLSATTKLQVTVWTLP